MANRQAQRDAQRERRRQDRLRARREIRESRAAESPASPDDAPAASRHIPWAWIVVGVIAAIVIGVGGFFLVRTVNAPLPGESFPSLGNMHITPGDSHPVYNSNPPTSGWHFPTWPQRGIYTSPLPEEYLLHFQEHAGVVVHYNPDKLPADQQDKLRSIVNSELDKGQGLVVLSPDASIPQAVAITSWQHLQGFDGVSGNESKIKDFIERLQCNFDPEGVCGPPHGVSFQPSGTPGPGVATVVSGQIPGNVPPGGTMSPGQKAEPPAATPAGR